jgi:hypothetical protein
MAGEVFRVIGFNVSLCHKGGMMKFNTTALAITTGVFWGAAILLVSLANLIWPGYGVALLDLASSVYPGYQPGTGFGSVIVGTLYAAIDGAVAGAIFAWLYNFAASRHGG